jgi:uncharacterized phage protein gp47/JayE
MSFTRPTLAEIIARMEADASALLLGGRPVVKNYTSNIAGIPVTRISFLWVVIRVFAGAVHLCYGFISWAIRQIFASTADADYLDRHASDLDITRKPAAYATGEVTFAGVDEAVIPAGTIIQRSDGTQYQTTGSNATIADGEAVVSIQAMEPGANGNATTAEVLSLVNPIEDVESSVAINADITTGADQETDADLLARVLYKKRNPPQGGAVRDYMQWATEVAGVWKAVVFPCYGGPETDTNLVSPGYVGIAVITATGTHIPDSTLIDAVQANIDAKKPVTATAIVYAPTAKNIDIEINLSPNTADVRAAVEAALAELIANDGEPDSTLVLSHIDEAISGADGEFDHELISPSEDVVMTKAEFPVLNSFTYHDLS